MSDTADLRFTVFHGVESLALTVARLALSTRLTEVDVTGQFAQDHQIEILDQFRFQRRRCGQFLVNQCRAQIGEQTELFANSQQALFRTHSSRQLIVLWATDGTEQNCIGRLCQFQRARRQRITLLIVAGAPDGRLFDLDFQTITAQGLEDAQGLLDDFLTNTVTGENCNFHVYPVSV